MNLFADVHEGIVAVVRLSQRDSCRNVAGCLGLLDVVDLGHVFSDNVSSSLMALIAALNESNHLLPS